MELDFPRRRIFNTTFTTPPNAAGATKPAYCISTTRSWTLLPAKSTIMHVGTEDPEKHRIVAEIIWNWPSQDRSYVHFGGYLYSLTQFLGRANGFLNNESFITINGETYTWNSYAFEPTLYDSNGRQVVTYKRDPCGLRKPNNLAPLGHLKFSEEIAQNQSLLDAVFISFFIFKTTRDVSFPWQKKVKNVPEQQAQEQEQKQKQEDSKVLEGQKPETGPETRPASDGLGEYARLPDTA